MRQFRLLALTVSGFRGFARAETFSLDADVVIVRGSNGSGKTSLVDALTWVLTGNVRHVDDQLVGLKLDQDPLVNLYTGETAHVSLEVRVGAEAYSIHRSGTRTDNELTVTQNNSPYDLCEFWKVIGVENQEAFASAVASWGVLSQATVSQALDGGGSELSDRLSGLLGLTELDEFVDAVAAAEKRLGETHGVEARKLADARERSGLRKKRVDELEARRQHEPAAIDLAEEASRRITSSMRRGWRVIWPEPAEISGEIERLQSEVKAFTAALARLRASREAMADLPLVDSDGGTVLVLEAQLRDLADQIASRETENSELRELVRLALGHLDAECPICAQSIDAAEVHAKLEERLATFDAPDAELQRLFEMREATEVELASATAVERARLAASQDVANAEESLATFVDGLNVLVRPEVEEATPTDPSFIEWLGEIRAVCEEAVMDISGSFDGRLLRSARLELDASRSEEKTSTESLELIEARRKEAKAFLKASQTAKNAVVQSTIDQLHPSLSEVFDRLRPHPTLDQLSAERKLRFRKERVNPVVRDVVADKTANPITVFSEAQLNVVAISYGSAPALVDI